MILKFKAGSEEWLRARQNFITATEAGAIVGVNPYLSAGQMLNKKSSPDKLNNKFLRAGKIYESAVIAALKIDLGWDVGYLDGTGEASYIFTDQDSPLSATPDAWRFDEPALIEAKTTGETNFDKYWRSGDAPPWYLSQAQVQMICTNMPKTYLVCMLAQQDPIISVVEVERCHEFGELVRDLARKFHRREIARVPNGTKEKATILLKNSIRSNFISEYVNDYNTT